MSVCPSFFPNRTTWFQPDVIHYVIQLFRSYLKILVSLKSDVVTILAFYAIHSMKTNVPYIQGDVCLLVSCNESVSDHVVDEM